VTRAGRAAAPAPPAPPETDPEFAELVAKITREGGCACSSYKDRCLRRRIAVRMRATGAQSYAAYARVLDRDRHEFERLLDALTVNVTKFFRNWDVFATLERTAVRALWELGEAPLRIWSAGCASGEEAYSLAVLFHHDAAARGELPRPREVSVLGTDIDRGCVAAAERGRYAESAFAETPAELRRAYFSDERPAAVHWALRAMVTFEQRDLLRPAPPGPFHLISCRNVVIYFDRSTQEALFERLRDALAPGGYLLLGKVETLFGRARAAFAPVHPRERIFRRV
jgi:chemotaxis methyl-accepting protein methylase